MASVSTNKKTGTRRVQFVTADGTRKTLHVGRVSMAAATEIGAHLDHLVRCQQTREDFRQPTRLWIEHIRSHWPRLAKRIVSLGLIPETTIDTATRRPVDVCFADFADQMISERTDLKPNTIRLWRQTAVRIKEFFGALTISGVNAKDASDFKRWLLSPGDKGGAGYAITSAGKHMAVTKAFLKDAVDARIIDSSPFSKVVIERQRNRSLQRFVDSSVVEKVISLCADPEFQAVIALARWGGLRTPSEPFAMQWQHIDWDRRRIQVHSVKTETQGKPTREVPLFPELVPFLTALRNTGESDAMSPESFVFRGLRRCTGANLRRQMVGAVRDAGFDVWPRIFRNLRSSRQTELEERFPRKTVCSWMGNSEQVADQHYLQVREEYFEKAADG